MSDYTIKPFQWGYEELQEKVGIEAAKSFYWPHQASAAYLKSKYSQEGVDTSTRLFAFKGDEVVGYLASAIKGANDEGIIMADLTPPSVLPEHKEVEELLFNKAIQVLKEKGAQRVRSPFWLLNNQYHETAKRWGYEYQAPYFFLYKVNLDDIDTSVPEDENIKSSKDELQLILKEDGEIKASVDIIVNDLVPTICRIDKISADSEEHMSRLLIETKRIVEIKKIEKFYYALPTEEEAKDSRYKPMKLEYVDYSAYYTKEL